MSSPHSENNDNSNHKKESSKRKIDESKQQQQQENKNKNNNKRKKSPWDWVYQQKGSENTSNSLWSSPYLLKSFSVMSCYTDFDEHLLSAVKTATNCNDATTQLLTWMRSANIYSSSLSKSDLLALYSWMGVNLPVTICEAFRKCLESKHYFFNDYHVLSEHILDGCSKEQLLCLLLIYVGYNEEFQELRGKTVADLKTLIQLYCQQQRIWFCDIMAFRDYVNSDGNRHNSLKRFERRQHGKKAVQR